MLRGLSQPFRLHVTSGQRAASASNVALLAPIPSNICYELVGSGWSAQGLEISASSCSRGCRQTRERE